MCAYLLMKVYGHVGIAIGGTIGTWSNAMLLLLYLKVNNLYAGCEALRIKLGYVFLSAASMVAV
ncbi:integral membrane MviN domain protein [Anaplasma phagocytophilum str. CRT53-1]|uniref:Integral membrane MviN domain protein n=1 Tax=Anaplasma phagocytophilum str. CRT53-1 TaxID=1359157 RepID=A0A0F3PIG4_ANAPH|nr:integral membrane MviN domain protein [Anaplasma phagocytophilum str. CRT53-1]